MSSARFSIVILLLLLAAFVVVMNWRCALVSLRNKRRGIDRHHSMVPLVSIVLAALAYLIYPRPDMMWLFAIPLLDIANWNLLWLPVVLFRQAVKR